MKPKQYFFVLVGVTVLLIGGGVAGYVYATSLLGRQAASLRESLAQVAVAGEHVDQLKQLRKQYLTLSPKFAKLNLALPTTKKQSELVLQLQQLAINSGMSIPTASFTGLSTAGALPSATSQTVQTGSVIALPLSFQLTGTYDQLQSFLTRLEQLNRYTNVTTLNIIKSDTKNTLTFSITLNAFVKP